MKKRPKPLPARHLRSTTDTRTYRLDAFDDGSLLLTCLDCLTKHEPVPVTAEHIASGQGFGTLIPHDPPPYSLLTR